MRSRADSERGKVKLTPLTRQPAEVRQLAAIERWVLSQLGTTEHERRVTQIASKLFDLTLPLHGLTANDRRLLRLAAMAHDVGRAIDDDTHPALGAQMILDAASLPLTDADRRALAYLTRYHRGAAPEPRTDEVLSRGDDHDALLRVLALLRAADGLDSRSLESPRLVFALHGPRLSITCYLDNDSPKARKVYTRRKKFRLLEETLACRVEVEVSQATSLHLVA